MNGSVLFIGEAAFSKLILSDVNFGFIACVSWNIDVIVFAEIQFRVAFVYTLAQSYFLSYLIYLNLGRLETLVAWNLSP